MKKILSGLQGVELYIYMDDVIIYADSLRTHQIKLEKFLGRIQTARLTLQPEKCLFLRREVTYLGHLISENGVRPDPQKTQAVKNFPRPKTTKHIKQYLGLCGYYRRHIPNFALIAKPLTSLLKKETPFSWGEKQEKAFTTLKDVLCSAPILQYPNFSEPFLITTDASFFAIGCVLSQGKIGQDLPIAYASRTLNSAEVKYLVTDKEFLAIIFALGLVYITAKSLRKQQAQVKSQKKISV